MFSPRKDIFLPVILSIFSLFVIICATGWLAWCFLLRREVNEGFLSQSASGYAGGTTGWCSEHFPAHLVHAPQSMGKGSSSTITQPLHITLTLRYSLQFMGPLDGSSGSCGSFQEYLGVFFLFERNISLLHHTQPVGLSCITQLKAFPKMPFQIQSVRSGWDMSWWDPTTALVSSSPKAMQAHKVSKLIFHHFCYKDVSGD